MCNIKVTMISIIIWTLRIVGRIEYSGRIEAIAETALIKLMKVLRIIQEYWWEFFIYYLSAKLRLVWKLKVYKIKIIQMKALWKSIKIIYRILKHCRDFIRRFPIKARRHYWCENSALIIKIMNLFTHRTSKSEMESLVFANQNKSKKKKNYSRKRRNTCLIQLSTMRN